MEVARNLERTKNVPVEITKTASAARVQRAAFLGRVDRSRGALSSVRRVMAVESGGFVSRLDETEGGAAELGSDWSLCDCRSVASIAAFAAARREANFSETSRPMSLLLAGPPSCRWSGSRVL